jgi:hypothetical protein
MQTPGAPAPEHGVCHHRGGLLVPDVDHPNAGRCAGLADLEDRRPPSRRRLTSRASARASSVEPVIGMGSTPIKRIGCRCSQERCPPPAQ